MAIQRAPERARDTGPDDPRGRSDQLRIDRRRHRSALRRARHLRLLATILVVLAVHTAAVARLAARAPELDSTSLLTVLAALVTVTLVALDRHDRRGPLDEARAVAIQRGVQTLGASALVWVFADPLLGFQVPRLLPLVDVAALAAGLVGVRVVTRWATSAARRRGHLLREVVAVGVGDEVVTLERAAIDHPDDGLVIAGVVSDRVAHDLSDVEAPWLGEVDDLARVITEQDVDTVIVTPSGLPGHRVDDVVRGLQDLGVAVLLHNGLRSLSPARVQVRSLGYEPVMSIAPMRQRGLGLATKRAVDLVASVLLLLLLLPVVGLAALAVRREDGGPVLFRQERIGRDGVPFTLLKLRTMHVDAEERLAEVMAGNRREGPLFKLEDDPRITRAGRLLRATSIDELPQLVNVLRGDMSLVGPRPALPAEVAQFDVELQARTSVTPGITGLWQVEARDSASFAAYRRLDLYYVENWSLALDASILATTVRAVGSRAVRGVRGRGARLA